MVEQAQPRHEQKRLCDTWHVCCRKYIAHWDKQSLDPRGKGVPPYGAVVARSSDSSDLFLRPHYERRSRRVRLVQLGAQRVALLLPMRRVAFRIVQRCRQRLFVIQLSNSPIDRPLARVRHGALCGVALAHARLAESTLSPVRAERPSSTHARRRRATLFAHTPFANVTSNSNVSVVKHPHLVASARSMALSWITRRTVPSYPPRVLGTSIVHVEWFVGSPERRFARVSMSIASATVRVLHRNVFAFVALSPEKPKRPRWP